MNDLKEFNIDEAVANSHKFQDELESLLYKYFDYHWEFMPIIKKRSINFNLTIKKNTEPFYDDEIDPTLSYDGYYLSDGVYIDKDLL